MFRNQYIFSPTLLYVLNFMWLVSDYFIFCVNINVASRHIHLINKKVEVHSIDWHRCGTWLRDYIIHVCVPSHSYTNVLFIAIRECYTLCLVQFLWDLPWTYNIIRCAMEYQYSKRKSLNSLAFLQPIKQLQLEWSTWHCKVYIALYNTL